MAIIVGEVEIRARHLVPWFTTVGVLLLIRTVPQTCDDLGPPVIVFIVARRMMWEDMFRILIEGQWQVMVVVEIQGGRRCRSGVMGRLRPFGKPSQEQ